MKEESGRGRSPLSCRSRHETRDATPGSAQELPSSRLSRRFSQSRRSAASHAHARALAAEGSRQPGRCQAGRAEARRRAVGVGVHQARRTPAGEGRLQDRGQGTVDCLRPEPALRAGNHHVLQSRSQQGADRALPLQGQLLHAVRSPGVPAHHLFPGSPRRAGDLLGAHRGGPRAGAGAARQRQPDRAGHARRRQAPLCGVARPAPQALVPVRAGRRQSRIDGVGLHHHVGEEGGPAHLCRARQGGPLRLGDGFAQALHALGRGALRARVRPRCVQHRRRVRLQHGSDGEQGAQHLQRRPGARLARDGDRQHLHRHRARHCARVLPQLDGKPHHLPRLVPALPQGGPDRLPRPGVRGGRAFAGRAAHQRGARAQGQAVPGGRRPARPSGAPGQLHRDQQLLHGHRLPEGRRGRAHAPDPAGA